MSFDLKNMVRLGYAVVAGLSAWTAPAADWTGLAALGLDESALVDVLPLAMEALAISQRAAVREARHKADLAKKGIAEVPPSAAARYVLNAGPAGKFVFDNFGEFYIDRRFVTKRGPHAGDGQKPYDRGVRRQRRPFACGVGDGSAPGQRARRLGAREDAPRTQKAGEALFRRSPHVPSRLSGRERCRSFDRSPRAGVEYRS